MFHVFPTRVRSGLNLKTVFQFSKPILGATVLYVCLPKSFISPFQVRKARAYIFTSIFGLSSSLFLDLYLMCWRNRGETCYFRPSETDSPRRDVQKQTRVTLELSLKRRALVLSEALSRSGDRRSPKRERVEALVCNCCLSPGEEPHLWARGGLAQARRARLSEHAKNLSGGLYRCLA
ncbi:hypothetical protein DEO72_LG11g647 [Vigna unguiculata]|uniref:Uncharacterized protein n=1 Tax=Vigna unguiculata TaxID=3917 RepID=A0A4D6NKS8_VIGUN|nr:hypothetical protein DEO72_LG11g647 [Vigna unguiculata]